MLKEEFNETLESGWRNLLQILLEAMMANNYDEDRICELCERSRPIFLVEKDNAILRMQEQFMPQFLKGLKQDFLNKREYIKLLKIKSNFIQMCACHRRFFHVYCGTAYVIKGRKIYCRQCMAYYHLHVKNE